MLARLARQPILRDVLARAGGRFDVAVVRVAQEMAKRSSRAPQDFHERLAYLEEVAKAYDAIPPEVFFAAPPAIAQGELRERFERDHEGGSVVDLSFDSGYVPRVADQRDKYLRWQENRTAHVRHFRHARPAPTVVCIHGYRTGTFSFEERAFAVPWLFKLGLDVAIFTLPFHALRAPAHRKRVPLFPTADVSRTNEAMGQAMWDLRKLIAWLRARGAPEVGVAGMSLGGYTTSLLATVELSLSFAIPFIPMADFTDAVVEHEALRGVAVPEPLIVAGKRALERVRPLSRAPVIPSDRMLIVAAVADGITKVSHADQLAAHFGAKLVHFPGAHLLQFGRREGFAAIARFLADRGVIRPRG
jgi:dienelactone hydrolase